MFEFVFEELNGWLAALFFLYVVLPTAIGFGVIKKLGLPRWNFIVMFLPVVNVILIWFAATARWNITE